MYFTVASDNITFTCAPETINSYIRDQLPTNNVKMVQDHKIIKSIGAQEYAQVMIYTSQVMDVCIRQRMTMTLLYSISMFTYTTQYVITITCDKVEWQAQFSILLLIGSST